MYGTFQSRNNNLANNNAVEASNNTMETKPAKTQIPNEKVATEGTQLKRELGLFSAINMILGVMIGSGIFVSPAPALEYSGSVAMCIIIWTSCGLISLLGALAFAELGTVVIRSGAEYAYFLEAFGPLHHFWGAVPSFVCSWVYVVALRPAEVAIILLTFSEYLVQPILDVMDICSLDTQDHIKKIVALLALASITYINMYSVKLYVKIQNMFSSFKVIACLIVIFGGMYEIIIGHTENLHKGFEGTNYGPKNLALAFYSGLWAYDGWSAVTVVTEEVKKPEINIPRSIMISVPLVTALYVFMNVAYMTALNIPELISSPAVAVSFGERVLGPLAFTIPLGVVLSTFGCALSVQFGVTRLCYVAGQEGHMVESFSYVHINRLTPSPAVAFQGILTFLFIITGNILVLIEFASFLVWIFYGLAMVSLLVLRKTRKNVLRPYLVPTWIPIFIIFVAMFLAFVPIITDPSPHYLFAVAFIILGIFIYYWFIYKNKRPAWMDKATKMIQVIFEVVPPSSHNE